MPDAAGPSYGEIALELGIATATVGASFIPLVGESMDLAVIISSEYSWWERALAAGSLAVNVATVGVLPNAGAAIMAARRIQTGSYTNTYASGKTYVGKGSRKRSQVSGRRIESEYDDPHVATDWTPAESTREAFKQESRRLGDVGGPSSPNNYNKIEPPGKQYRKQDNDL